MHGEQADGLAGQLVAMVVHLYHHNPQAVGQGRTAVAHTGGALPIPRISNGHCHHILLDSSDNMS